jgi:hypothetical protein
LDIAKRATRLIVCLRKADGKPQWLYHYTIPEMADRVFGQWFGRRRAKAFAIELGDVYTWCIY